MTLSRRSFMAHSAAVSLAFAALPVWAADRQAISRDVLSTWTRLILELVRHTATYSPPVPAAPLPIFS